MSRPKRRWWDTQPKEYWTAEDWRAARKATVVPPLPEPPLDPEIRLYYERAPKPVSIPYTGTARASDGGRQTRCSRRSACPADVAGGDEIAVRGRGTLVGRAARAACSRSGLLHTSSDSLRVFQRGNGLDARALLADKPVRAALDQLQAKF